MFPPPPAQSQYSVLIRVRCRDRSRLRVGGGRESRLGLKIVLGCKLDKIFLRAPLVFMEHRAPQAPMEA